jgi:hypothetical protein
MIAFMQHAMQASCMSMQALMETVMYQINSVYTSAKYECATGHYTAPCSNAVHVEY